MGLKRFRFIPISIFFSSSPAHSNHRESSQEKEKAEKSRRDIEERVNI